MPIILGIDTRFGIVGNFTWGGARFFAYISFDIFATTSEEAHNPQKDIPIGIFASLGICTGLYILASVVFTGLKPYERLATAAPAATALSQTPFPAAPFVDPLALLVGLTGVVMILGQSRLAFAVSRGNLLPPRLARVHASFRTPYRISDHHRHRRLDLGLIATSHHARGLVNIGTLAALVLVPLGRSGRSGFR